MRKKTKKTKSTFCHLDNIHLCPLSNYFLQTLQIYSDFIQSFPLSKSELLYSILLMKYLLGDLF